ncbi:MAG TPA: 30S ribosomal protein S20 [Gammaproteobacteria bacterium]|nr:30S ribosomal protein S20 [Gammaproteobacteria bacterium]
MANIKSAQKRARQSVKNRAHNMAMRSKMRTYLKKIVTAIESGDRAAAEASYKEAVPVLDSMVTKGIVHKNKAARHKSRLNARIRSLQA